MSFQGIEDSEELGSPFELYMFEYADSPDSEVSITYGEERAISGLFGPIEAAKYNPQGNLIALVTSLPNEGSPGFQFVFRLLRKVGTEWQLWMTSLPQPTAKATTIAWSHDGVHLAVGSLNIDGEDNLSVYRFGYNSSDQPTSASKISSPFDSPVNRPVSGGQVHKLAYSPDGLHLAVAADAAPYVTIYRRSADSYVKLNGALDLNPPASSTDLVYVGNRLIVASTVGAPLLYLRSGDSYTRSATIPMDVTGGVTSTKLAASISQGLVLASKSIAPFVEVFKLGEGASVERTHDLLAGGASSEIVSMAFGQEGNRLLLSQTAAPYVLSYSVDNSVVYRDNKLIVATPGAYQVAFSPNTDEVFFGRGSGEPEASVRSVTTEVSSFSGYFAYTNFERDVTRVVPLYGEVLFKAIPISRQAYSADGKAEARSMTINMPRDEDMARLMIPYPTPRPVAVTVFGTHSDDPDNQILAIWNGRLLSLAREGDGAVLTCDSSIVSLKRLGLRRNYQFACPYVLYGELCRADKDAATIETVVVDIVDGIMVLAGGWFGARDPSDFAGGMISWTSSVGREVRTIRSVTPEGGVTYVGPARGARIGTTVTLSLGCNRRRDHCADLHNNINNFGGQPWIPDSNPHKYHPFW